MDFKEFKEEYELLRKKFSSLPDFKLLDAEFEFCFGDYEKVQKSSVLVMIRRRMTEKIALIVNILQNIVFPNSGSIVSLNESKFFDESDKLKANELMASLMAFERRSLNLDLKHVSKDDGKYISELMVAWPDFLSKTLSLTKKLSDGWNKTDKFEFSPYMG